jgi:hypothetical protein
MQKISITMFLFYLTCSHSIAVADPLTWISVGEVSPPITSMVVDRQGGQLYIATTSYLYKIVDHGIHWDSVPEKFLSNIIAKDTNFLLGCTSKGPSRSFDAGETWSSISMNLGFCPDQICLHPNGDAYYRRYSGNNLKGVYRSTDNGDSWKIVYTGPLIYPPPLFISPDGDLFLGGPGYRSRDLGETWISTPQGLNPLDTTTYPRAISSLAFLDSNVILAANLQPSKNILRTNDYGNHWALVYSGNISSGSQSLVADSAGNVFLATADGVYQTSNSGLLWNSANDGLSDTNIQALIIDNQGFLFATDSSGHIFRTLTATCSLNPRKIIKESIQEYSISISCSHTLFPTIRIKYVLNRSSHVTLSICNMQGRKITSMFDEYQSPGMHSKFINITKSSRYMYIYRFVINGKAFWGKIIL